MRSSPWLLLLATAVLAIPAAACGAPSRSPVIVPDAPAAEARYREWHRTHLAPTLGAEDRKQAEGLIARRPNVKHSSCREARKVAEARSPLHGSLAALDRDGDCWVLRWDGMLGLGLGAVVAEDGEVLLAWWIPEG